MKKSIKFAETTVNEDDDDGSKNSDDPQQDIELPIAATATTESSVSVEVRVVFLKIGSISIKDSKFSCEAFLEASWFDANFQAKKSNNQMGEELQYNEKIHWNPRIVVQNLTASSNQEIWYHVEKQNYGCKVSERRRLKGNYIV